MKQETGYQPVFLCLDFSLKLVPLTRLKGHVRFTGYFFPGGLMNNSGGLFLPNVFFCVARCIKPAAFFLLMGVSCASAQSLSTNPANFRGMPCQQLWYVEQEVLAEGRVCLKTERARRAFSRAERCISGSESILPKKARDYLAELRSVARNKRCPEF